MSTDHEHREQQKKQSRWGFRGKTVWDWLPVVGAFLIPIMITVGTWWITWQQARIENQRAAAERTIQQQNAQDEALQAYLDQMSTLLLDKNLLGSNSSSEAQTSEARKLARARTLTALRRLGPEDKASVVQFLYESGLILRKGPGTFVGPSTSADSIVSSPDCTPEAGLRLIDSIVSLEGADLRGASLSGADLTGANLSGADLTSTVLRGADLRGAVLRHAYLAPAFPAGQPVPSHAISILQNTDLREADLRHADLRHADLCFAKLNKDSKLSGVDLSDAALFGLSGVTIDRLERKTESLDGAMMPNEQK